MATLDREAVPIKRLLYTAFLSVLIASAAAAALTGFLNGSGAPGLVTAVLGALAWFVACTYALGAAVERMLASSLPPARAWLLSVPSLAVAVAVSGILFQLGIPPLWALTGAGMAMTGSLAFLLRESIRLERATAE